jgi:uncharacterized protein YcbK (DUF882 family)
MKKSPPAKRLRYHGSGFKMPLARRRFLMGAGAVFLAPASPALAKLAVGNARALAFENIHTGEKLKIEYWADGQYLPDALVDVNHILRDFRSGEIHPIAPQLLDLLSFLNGRLETAEPFSVISGYRSPATNALLRGEHEHSGVASKSLHMQGMAIDIRVNGRPLQALRNAALVQRAGGVGYYPQSDFVHVDVGRVRIW